MTNYNIGSLEEALGRIPADAIASHNMITQLLAAKSSSGAIDLDKAISALASAIVTIEMNVRDMKPSP